MNEQMENISLEQVVQIGDELIVYNRGTASVFLSPGLRHHWAGIITKIDRSSGVTILRFHREDRWFDNSGLHISFTSFNVHLDSIDALHKSGEVDILIRRPIGWRQTQNVLFNRILDKE